MNYNIPENQGIPSGKILEFYRYLDENGLSTHAVYIARGNDIVSFAHWKPFTQKYLHRMYSVSKSFVSIAVGFAVQDGLIDLDESITTYFPAETEGRADDNVRAQTVRKMLTMSTARPAPNWFRATHPNRVDRYFDNPAKSRVPGTMFEYDSSGSFVLGALVERVTGMPFMDYLREKLFDKIGVSKEAYCLRCPGGHSWGDSAVLCTSLDLVKMVRFVANDGAWEGEQLLDADYVHTARTPQIANPGGGDCDWETSGYGYQIWCGRDDSFFFNGMGCQFGAYFPHKDMIFVYNGDNQGMPGSLKKIFDGFYDIVYSSTVDEILPVTNDREKLRSAEEQFALMADRYPVTSPMTEKIRGKTFVLDENPMGITRFTVDVDASGEGQFRYTNGQGDLAFGFGMGYNVFGKFPQEGYSDEVGNVSVSGHKYGCAVSAGWYEPAQMHLNVQITDKYFGRLHIFLEFSPDAERVHVRMTKTAEDFLQTYAGEAEGVVQK